MRVGRVMRAGVSFAAIVVVCCLGGASAYGVYGDGFGIAPINDGAGPAQEVPALPGESHAFWAGTCDRGAAPGPGVSLVPLGGIGSRPATVQAPPQDASVAPRVAAPPVPASCIDWGDLPVSPGPDLWTGVPGWRLPAVTEAGSHPDGTATFWFTRGETGKPAGSVDNVYVDLPPGFVGDPNAVPKCTAEQFAVKPLLCPPQSQVGVLRIYMSGGGGLTSGNYNIAKNNEQIVPVFNLQPRQGNVAELGLAYLGNSTGAGGFGFVTARIVAKARTNQDFGVTSFIGQIPSALPIYAQAITLWGVPWESANDVWRMPQGINDAAAGNVHPVSRACGINASGDERFYQYSGLTPECRVAYDPSWGPIRPFISLETDCNPSPVTGLATDSYMYPGSFTAEGDPVIGDPNWLRYSSASPAVTGCESLDFDPDIDFAPTSRSADGASGLGVDLQVPQKTAPPIPTPAADAPDGEVDGYVSAATDYWKSPAGRATAHLKDTVVALPDGVSVNPSAATGLQACPDSVVGVRQQGNPPLFDNSDPTDGVGGYYCPGGSRIATATVRTHLLEEPLTGDVVLGQPKSTDPQSGEMFRMFLILRDKQRGLVAKIYGSAKADPSTGRLVATFANNPELPFTDLDLDFKAGAKGVLALPRTCGNPGWSTAFTPWSSVGAPVAVADRHDGGTFAIDRNCGSGFSPGLAAGMDTQAARGHGSFSFRLDRPEGDQYLRGLTTTLPKGLLASVRDLPLCSDAQANAGSCPLGSQVGIVDAKAGSGDPFVLEEKGRVYLTDGYKGGQYGLAVEIHPVAGPFRGNMGLSPIIVRQAIHVDPKTAQVTAISDPFPLIHHGVPLRVREVTVLIDRASFMLNPSDCAHKRITTAIHSADGATVTPYNHFQAANCKDLAFKPKLALRLTGRKQTRTGKHPGIRAQVTQNGIGEAGIEKAKVTLPKSLALDVDNAQALCEFEAGTKPDLENHCPKGSIVGRARAKTPLLNHDLAGDVYFVKNVRIDKDTGNDIRTLPMIIVALRGEIAVNLVGESNTTKSGRLVNTFDEVPDAPITRFNLNIAGGNNGILAVTRTRKALINLCTKPKSHTAEADIDGHNGKRYDRNIRMKTPCRKQRRSVAKVCRNRTNTKPAFKRCVVKVKRNRAQAKRRAAKKKADKRKAATKGDRP